MHAEIKVNPYEEKGATWVSSLFHSYAKVHRYKTRDIKSRVFVISRDLIAQVYKYGFQPKINPPDTLNT